MECFLKIKNQKKKSWHPYSIMAFHFILEKGFFSQVFKLLSWTCRRIYASSCYNIQSATLKIGVPFKESRGFLGRLFTGTCASTQIEEDQQCLHMVWRLRIIVFPYLLAPFWASCNLIIHLVFSVLHFDNIIHMNVV